MIIKFSEKEDESQHFDSAVADISCDCCSELSSLTSITETTRKDKGEDNLILRSMDVSIKRKGNCLMINRA